MIYILTGPIRSGKTTALEVWAKDQKGLGGFLSPDRANRRKILLLSSNETIPFECDLNMDVDAIPVGKFNFLKSSFDTASARTLLDIHAGKALIVIDEIGKLELRNQGFSALLKQVLLMQSNHHFDLYLVIRDTLLKQILAQFSIHNFIPLNIEHLKSFSADS